MDIPSYLRYKYRGESCVGEIGDSQDRILQVEGLCFVPVLKPRFNILPLCVNEMEDSTVFKPRVDEPKRPRLWVRHDKPSDLLLRQPSNNFKKYVNSRALGFRPRAASGHESVVVAILSANLDHSRAGAHGLPPCGHKAVLYSSIWVPQIVRAALTRRGRPFALGRKYVIGTTVGRMLLTTCRHVTYRVVSLADAISVGLDSVGVRAIVVCMRASRAAWPTILGRAGVLPPSARALAVHAFLKPMYDSKRALDLKALTCAIAPRVSTKEPSRFLYLGAVGDVPHRESGITWSYG
ncbi:hypothetical protein EDB84DRAFT_1621487 [Lactarius hengduanensis]|nr:hypothetical protein EDB84DRAFT_1621487 [Lactarius hengduanensis]